MSGQVTKKGVFGSTKGPEADQLDDRSRRGPDALEHGSVGVPDNSSTGRERADDRQDEGSP